ncbi:MAG: PQQ-binding-like beta-propeller repeat protein [Gemmataceae bacterium]
MISIRGTLLAALVVVAGVSAEDWPQWMGPQRDAVWRETGIVEKFPAGGPKVLWRAPVHWGYSGPAVADGHVYLMDFDTKVDVLKRNPFDTKTKVPGRERVLCLDQKTGKEVWKHDYECSYGISYAFGPRCTPTVVDGKVYTLGAEGNLLCLDAKKGSVLWSKDFPKDYEAKTPFWGFCGHPLVDGKKLICITGGKGGIVRAYDKDTGAELWKSLEAKDLGYSPPTIIEAGGQRQLLIWTGQAINSLNPETGKLYWSVPLETTDAMSIMSPRKLGDFLFAGGRQAKSVLLKLDTDKPGAQEVWRGNRDVGLAPINMTPFLENGLIIGVDQPGVMHAVDIQNGKRLWGNTLPITGEEKKPAGSGTAFVVKQGDRFVLFSETGHLILAQMDRRGYTEIDRWQMLEPTSLCFGRKVVWSHPAFADRCVFARNDKEIVCVSLAK